MADANSTQIDLTTELLLLVVKFLATGSLAAGEKTQAQSLVNQLKG